MRKAPCYGCKRRSAICHAQCNDYPVCTYNEPGYSLCKGCIERRKRHDQKYDPTGERRRQNNQRRREERIAAGLCTECGKPVDIPGHVCLRCKEMRRDNVRIYKLKKRIERQTEETRRRLDAKNV